MAEDSTTEQGLTERRPSADDWELEIRKALQGEREYALIDLGSITSYFRKQLKKSEDIATAKTHFHKAVRRIVLSWQPAELEQNNYVARMLDLIGGFTPNEGFVKIMGFMQQGWRFDEIPRSQGAYGAGQDLHMKALVVLGNFYPTAPPLQHEDLAFNDYVDLLHSHLDDSRYGAYSAERLLSLGALQPEDEPIGVLIERSPEALHELVPLYLNPARHLQAGHALTQFHIRCNILGQDAEQHFENALQSKGAEFDRKRGIIRFGGSVINLDTPQEYTIRRWGIGRLRGIAKLKSIAAAARGGTRENLD